MYFTFTIIHPFIVIPLYYYSWDLDLICGKMNNEQYFFLIVCVFVCWTAGNPLLDQNQF